MLSGSDGSSSTIGVREQSSVRPPVRVGKNSSAATKACDEQHLMESPRKNAANATGSIDATF
jgi:hypothetical protein